MTTTERKRKAKRDKRKKRERKVKNAYNNLYTFN